MNNLCRIIKLFCVVFLGTLLNSSSCVSMNYSDLIMKERKQLHFTQKDQLTGESCNLMIPHTSPDFPKQKNDRAKGVFQYNWNNQQLRLVIPLYTYTPYYNTKTNQVYWKSDFDGGDSIYLNVTEGDGLGDRYDKDGIFINQDKKEAVIGLLAEFALELYNGKLSQ